MRRLIIILTLFIASFQIQSHAQSDLKVSQDTVLFHFKPGSFDFVPEYRGNETVVRMLEEYANKHRDKIEKGDFVIRVNTYTESGKNISSKRAKHLSYLRSIRMKSYMILFRGMKEEYFRTTNHIGNLNNLKDVSVLSFIVNPEKEITEEVKQQVEELLVKEQEEKVLIREQEVKAAGELALDAEIEVKEDEQKAEAEIKDHVKETEHRPEVVRKPDAVATVKSQKRERQPLFGDEPALSLRINLLEWALLTPNIGVEYRINSQWSAIFDLNWTHWNWKDGDRHYRLWSIAPSVNYHINSHWYAGTGYQGGSFGFKLGTDGKQGSFHSFSLLGGYKLKLNKVLSLDFGLGLGYLRASYDRYLFIDGCNVVQETGTKKNYFGPTHANVTLVWSISNFLSEKK